MGLPRTLFRGNVRDKFRGAGELAAKRDRGRGVVRSTFFGSETKQLEMQLEIRRCSQAVSTSDERALEIWKPVSGNAAGGKKEKERLLKRSDRLETGWRQSGNGLKWSEERFRSNDKDQTRV
jgi:hypothetical protein